MRSKPSRPERQSTSRRIALGGVHSSLDFTTELASTGVNLDRPEFILRRRGVWLFAAVHVGYWNAVLNISRGEHVRSCVRPFEYIWKDLAQRSTVLGGGRHEGDTFVLGHIPEGGGPSVGDTKE